MKDDIKRRNMPRKYEIAKYWIPLLVNNKFELDYYYDFVFNENMSLKTSFRLADKNCKMCFACTVESDVERAHIIPLCNGGTNDVGNLNLLCKFCHIESELIDNLDAYTFWLKNKSIQNSGIFQERLRLCKEYVKQYSKGNYNVIPSHYLKSIEKYKSFF